MEAIRKAIEQPAISTNDLEHGQSGADKVEGGSRMPFYLFEQPAAPRQLSLLKMSDEILDYYAFLFCQRGFRSLGMTFEQFLEVVDAVRPGGLRASYDWK
jgi:hypothetical protein